MTKPKPKKKSCEPILNVTNNLTKLKNLLNKPETGCTFWHSAEEGINLHGYKSIFRTTVEIINKNGFMPYNKTIDEKLFKVFKIYLEDKNENLTVDKIKKIKDIAQSDGSIYIRHKDPVYIYEAIKNSN